jgi:hypothetical protein
MSNGLTVLHNVEVDGSRYRKEDRLTKTALDGRLQLTDDLVGDDGTKHCGFYQHFSSAPVSSQEHSTADSPRRTTTKFKRPSWTHDNTNV